jgi:hypothetical protein
VILGILVNPVLGDQTSRNCSISFGAVIADNLSKAGWNYGYVSAVDCEGRTIWIVDAHRGDGKRFVVRADEKLTAFLELERAIHAFAVSLML